MDTTTRNGLTPLAHFFLAPENPLHRQYEAFRAYFVDGRPSLEVARRFGYAPGSFRVLCHQFRHDPDKQIRFFQSVQHGPRFAPVRDRVRELVVAMRKRNLSVYDIQRELGLAGHTVSINALAVLLREEGFARLPRRLEEERPAALRPGTQATADVRALSLQPRSFRTRLGGLFFFAPLLNNIRLAEVLRQADLPSSQMVPAEQALRTLLALKLVGTERKSHVMDLVCDQGIALFAGLNVVPKRSYLASYSSRVDHRAVVRLMAAWFDEVRRAGLPRGDSIDLDFQPQPRAAGRAGVPGSRRRRPRPVLRARRHPQRPKGSRNTSFRRLLARTHRQAARRTGLRFATDHLRTPSPVEPTRHWFPHAPTPHAAHAGPHLEPAGVGLATHHLAIPDPRLPHAPRPGRTRSASRLRRPSAANHRDRSRPRGTDHPSDQQPPSRLPQAGDPL